MEYLPGAGLSCPEFAYGLEISPYFVNSKGESSKFGRQLAVDAHRTAAGSRSLSRNPRAELGATITSSILQRVLMGIAG